VSYVGLNAVTMDLSFVVQKIRRSETTKRL
jgi:hypothetical protein